MRFITVALTVLVAAQGSVNSPAITQTDCAGSTRVWTPIIPAVVKTRVEPSWPNPTLNDTRGMLILDLSRQRIELLERFRQPVIERRVCDQAAERALSGPQIFYQPGGLCEGGEVDSHQRSSRH